jgi:hypothetical protein
MTAYLTRGLDTGGRPIRMSPQMDAWWDLYVAALGFTPTITQGGWMGDLAADLSGPTHDADALDLRVWDRTQNQVEAMVRTARALGAAAWLRNKQHGGFTDPHIHLVPGRWAHPSPSALRQWDALRAGRDGLANNGPDYHPYPLANTPPEDDMPYTEKQLAEIVRAAVREELKATGLDQLARLERDRAVIDRRKHGQTQDLVKDEG